MNKNYWHLTFLEFSCNHFHCSSNWCRHDINMFLHEPPVGVCRVVPWAVHVFFRMDFLELFDTLASIPVTNKNHYSSNKFIWLVVSTPLKNISQWQWEELSHILWKIKNVWNHQPVIFVIFMGYISYYYDMMYIEHLLGRPLHIQVAPCRCLSCTPFLSFGCLDIGEVGLSDPLLSDDEDLKTPRGLGNQVNMV